MSNMARNMDLSAPLSLPSRITSQIATELYDRILLHVFLSSKPALSGLSLVNKAWLFLCRRYLFYSINLTSTLVDHLCSSPHALTAVVPHLRSVALGGRWLCDRQNEWFVLPFFGKLQGIHKVYLETWTLDLNTAHTLSVAMSNHCQTLTVLSLKYIRLPSFTLLTHIISELEALEKLSLDNVTWSEVEGSQSQIIAPPSKLRKLKSLLMFSCFIQPALGWLQESPRLEISALNLPEFLPGDVDAVGCFLRSLGECLQHLEVGMLSQYSDESSDVLHGLDLSSNTGLRSLEIHQLTLYHVSPHPAASVRLLPLLSTMTSSQLAKLTLHLWFSEESQLDQIDWGDVGRLLAASKSSLAIRVRGLGRGRGDVMGWIRRRLDGASVVLDVVFEDT